MSTHSNTPRHREWKLACKVYIGNLAEGASKTDIEDAFGKYGALKNVWVARNPPGFAFVEFEDVRDAEDACRHLDGTRIAGGRIKAEMSHGRSRRGRGGGPPGFGRGPPPYPVGGAGYGGPRRGPPYSAGPGPHGGHYNGGGDYPYGGGYGGHGGPPRGGYGGHGGYHGGHVDRAPRHGHPSMRARSPGGMREFRHGYSRSRSNSLEKSPPRPTARPRTPPSRSPSAERH